MNMDQIPSVIQSQGAADRSLFVSVLQSNRQDTMRGQYVNLRDEYRDHLMLMSKMTNFDELKRTWDTAYYKSICQPFIDPEDGKREDDRKAREVEEILTTLNNTSNQNTTAITDLKNIGEKLIHEDLQSSIDKGLASTLLTTDENKIPRVPVKCQSSREIMSVWHEVSSMLDKEITQQDRLCKEDLLKRNSLSNFKRHVVDTLNVLHRWSKLINVQYGDLISPLIVDKLLKGLLIKMDGLIGAYEERSANDQETCQENFNHTRGVMTKILNDKIDMF